MNTIQEQRKLQQQDTEIRMIDLLIVAAKYKKMIAAITIAGAVLAVAISLVLPKIYQATTKLLPPQQTQSSATALLSQLGGIAGAAAGAIGMKNPNDLYVGMLKSRTIGDRIVERFNLKRVYQTDSVEQARSRLAKSTKITSGKDGLITVDFENTDKKLVAPVANAYVDELFRLMKTLAVTDAAQRRLFYQRQLEATKDNLTKAEINLKSKMDTRGVVSVDSESRAILETVARLRAQASAKEIQLTAMKAFLTPSNPEYRRAEEELISLRAELAKLENGRGVDSDGTASSQGGLENIKLLRELKYQQMLYEALAKQYEVARMDEAKDPSIIQILDLAVEPERRTRPQRVQIVVLATISSFVLAVCLAFIAESRRRSLMTPEGAAQWAELRSYLRRKKNG